jgi:hypothetical protein
MRYSPRLFSDGADLGLPQLFERASSSEFTLQLVFNDTEHPEG